MNEKERREKEREDERENKRESTATVYTRHK